MCVLPAAQLQLAWAWFEMRNPGLEHASGTIVDATLKEMRGASVALKKFQKPHWFNLARLNNRTHRELLVVDGTTGFTGV